MNETNITELEQACEVFLLSPEVISTQSGPPQALALFLDNPSNFRQLYSILLSSRHPCLVYLVSLSISKTISGEWVKLTIEEKQHIYNTFISMIFNKEAKPGYLIGGLCKTLARICRLGWVELEKTNKTTPFVIEIITKDFLLAEIGLKFFEELIIEILEPIKHRTITVNRKTAIKFRDEGLGNILSFCIFTLVTNKTLSSSIIKSLLTLINLSLGFDFLNINSDDSNEDATSLQIPLAWKTHFDNNSLLEMIKIIILNSDGEIEYLGIRVLNQMGAIRKSIFSNPEERKNYINGFCYEMVSIMTSKDLTDESLYEILQGFKRFLANFIVKEIAEALNFSLLLNSFFQFSLKLINNPDVLYLANYNSIAVWSFLSYEGNNQNDQISNYISSVLSLFIEKSFVSLSFSIFSIEKENDLNELLDNLSTFSIYYYPEIWKILQKFLFEEYEILKSGIIREVRVAWLIYISSALIAKESKKSGYELNDILIQNILQFIPSISQSGYCIELSVLSFCASFAALYLNSSIDNFWGDNSTMVGEFSIGQISSIIIKIILQNIAKYTDGKVLEESLNLFEKLCLGYYSTKVLVSLPEVISLLNYPNCAFANKKCRAKLFCALMNLWISDEASPHNFYESLGLKLKQAKNSEIDLINIFVEMTGICKALTTTKSFLEFFNVISDDIWELIRLPINNLQKPDLLLTILKFCKEFVNNRNSRLKLNVSEAFGIILFKNISQLLLFYCKNNLANLKIEGENIIEKTKKVLNIVNVMIAGEYICFGVFEVFNDNSFVSTISACFNLISKLSGDMTVFLI